MSNYFLYICKNKFLLIKTEAAMGYNSQSNIMKKLLLLVIIALTALFTACEKDKPEDNSNSSTFGLDISKLDINDPNLYYWTYTYSHCDVAYSYTTCVPGTNKFIIEEFIPYQKEQEELGKGCIKISNLSKISYEECDLLWQTPIPYPY